jgi:SAM-dependent methyltransferase
MTAMTSRESSCQLTLRGLRDAYGHEIWNCYKGNTTYEIVERDDGFIDLGSALPYFQEFNKWPLHEQKAIRRAHGRILDIGCGAGRVALYLERTGAQVVSIDSSPLAAKVAKLRGAKTVRVLSIDEIERLGGPFGTVVLLGNNFGLLGDMARARRLLGKMHRITAPDATIIAATTNPYWTRDPVHLAYHQRNRRRGRMAGQIRLRIRYRQFCGDWFYYLLASPDEVRVIVQKTGWTVSEVVDSQGPGYVAILEKKLT